MSADKPEMGAKDRREIKYQDQCCDLETAWGKTFEAALAEIYGREPFSTHKIEMG